MLRYAGSQHNPGYMDFSPQPTGGSSSLAVATKNLPDAGKRGRYMYVGPQATPLLPLPEESGYMEVQGLSLPFVDEEV